MNIEITTVYQVHNLIFNLRIKKKYRRQILQNRFRYAYVETPINIFLWQ